MFPIFFISWTLVAPPAVEAKHDPARLREVLSDNRDVRAQSQAALMLVNDRSAEAEAIVRRGFRQAETPEVFQALCTAVRLTEDRRFVDELIAALAAPGSGKRPGLREAASDALAAIADASVIERLETVLNVKDRLGMRQTVLAVLGRTGRKEAVPILIERLNSEHETEQRAAADALSSLTGADYGADAAQWRQWWGRQKDLPQEQWMHHRLVYQADRARRLDGELERTRGQLIRVHQLLYARLPAADRLAHIQTAAEQEDAIIRQLAVTWCTELLAAIGQGTSERDALTQKTLSTTLRRLTHDSNPEVQRTAVLGLGRFPDDTTFERLKVLLAEGRPTIRAAAARSLARTLDTEASRRKQVVGLLQKALEDPAFEVVVEAAEDLGGLGVAEAGPVLARLLRHPSSTVRLAAAQALERTADIQLVDDLLAMMDDRNAGVRFSLIGALGRAVAGRDLSADTRNRLLARLQQALAKDADAGVRSRAATMLGDIAPPAALKSLWDRVATVEDIRVQEKAWAAFVDVLARSGNIQLLSEWNTTLTQQKQDGHRLHLLMEVHSRWQQREDARSRFSATAELLVPLQLHSGKWQAALPQIRELLSRTSDGSQSREQAIQWLVTALEHALIDGDSALIRRTLGEVRQFLPRTGKWAEEIARLEQKAGH